ncbi:hypothetical protein ANCCAN_00130 [Ancylostoma caninum]|uniref:DDE Tnp4 domain-containing protein n=1 Tax=Ancylostoma caninum TaxID=29170 RepID=A0A368HAS4_ANCCA|nr:hypothetical protein ANCCAN_00130 [Ancylostoma caninum]
MDLILREEIETLTEEESVPRVYRDRSCPFDTVDDDSFRRRFRFTRAGFFRVVDLMRADLERAMPLITAQQLALTIRVLASRSFQLKAGDSFGVAQSTVSRVVASVSDWFHHNSERMFYDTGLPGIVGAIDGTQIAIPKPGDAQYSYINRKDFASINMGAIVDDNYRFLWFSFRWPGRAHDGRV